MEIVNTELWNSLRNLTPRAAAAAAGKAWKQGNKLNDGSTNRYPWIRFTRPLPSCSLHGLWQHMKTLSNMIQERDRRRRREGVNKRRTFSAMILLLFSSRPEQNVAYTQRRHCVYYVIDT